MTSDSYETTIDEVEPGLFAVVVTISGKRLTISTYASRADAEQAADAIYRSATRYEGAASDDPGLPNYSEAETSAASNQRR